MPSEAAAALLAVAGDVLKEGADIGAGNGAAARQGAGVPEGQCEQPQGAEGPREEKPPEDLELRRRLADLSEALGRETARRSLDNASKILGRLKEEPGNAKLHEMRRDILERAVGEELFFAFEAAGFAERPVQAGAAAAFVWSGDEAAARVLPAAFREVQRAADLCIDPATVSFAQVSELVQQNRTLPGIEEINDAVAEPVPPKESTLERPKKPWER